MENQLLKTEYKLPYKYYWTGVPASTYIITAVATDNCAKTTSAPTTTTVTEANTFIVSSKPNSVNNNTGLEWAVRISACPIYKGN